MSESQTDSTQAASPDETAPQPATETVAPLTGTEPTDETPAETDAEPEPKRTPWFQRRIDELTREKHEARRQADAYAAEVARYRQPQQQEQPQQPANGYVPADQVERAAAQLVEQSRFNDECNAVAEVGSAKYADFNEAVSNFAMLGGPPQPLLEAVTALGKEDGARVFYELGKDPDRAEALLRMSPARMAVQVAKMAATPPKIAAVSKAPPPVTPIGSGGIRAVDPGKLSPEAFADWFRKNKTY